MAKHIVVLGAGYAGMIAALRIAKKAKGVDITLINASHYFVERVRLHQVATNQKLKTHYIPDVLRGTPVKFVQGYVTSLNPDSRTLSMRDGQHISYDYLVYAVGSKNDRHKLPGVAQHAFTLSPDGERSARNLGDRLKTLSEGGRVIVIGGGLTGVEAASEIATQYSDLQVSLFVTSQFGKYLSQRGQVYLRKTFTQMNITVHENIRIKQVAAQAVIMENNEQIDCDICIWAGGFTTHPLAREAGIHTNKLGQVLIDPFLRSVSHPNIYAIGDCANFEEAPGAPIEMGCKTAEPTAAQASDNLAARLNGRPERPMGFAYVFHCISLGRSSGLVQWANLDGTPKERIMTGRMAVFIKEMICRLAWVSIPAQKYFPQLLLWRGKKNSSAAAELSKAHVQA